MRLTKRPLVPLTGAHVLMIGSLPQQQPNDQADEPDRRQRGVQEYGSAGSRSVVGLPRAEGDPTERGVEPG
jgi:hypothetical protein